VIETEGLGEGPDGVELALEQLQPRSAGMIIREAFYGTSRFEDFLLQTKMARSVLAAQLERLTQRAILTRVPYREEGRRERTEYQLTTKGRELGTALIALIDWSSAWSPPAGPQIVPLHRKCGARTHVVLCCEAGHTEITIDDVEPGKRTDVDPHVKPQPPTL
jgi:DNA-binding HxlR family transcriptional regulator